MKTDGKKRADMVPDIGLESVSIQRRIEARDREREKIKRVRREGVKGNSEI